MARDVRYGIYFSFIVYSSLNTTLLKNYWNQSLFAKVIIKRKAALFFWLRCLLTYLLLTSTTVIGHIHLNCMCLSGCQWRWRHWNVTFCYAHISARHWIIKALSHRHWIIKPVSHKQQNAFLLSGAAHAAKVIAFVFNCLCFATR